MHPTDKAIARLIPGVVFASAIFFAPGAFAHDYSSDAGYRHQSASEESYRPRHRHHIGHAVHRHHMFAGAHRHHRLYATPEYGFRQEAMMGEGRNAHARMTRAHYMSHASYAALEARREQLAAADERERPVTAELNLVQLRKGRDRAAEIAQWQLRYGGVASAARPSPGG